MFHVKHFGNAALKPQIRVILYLGDDVLKICISSQNKPLFAALSARFAGKACILENHSVDCNILVASKKTCYNAMCDVCLVDSAELPSLSGKGKIILPISCGMSEKDTVTFSSIDGERGVLCVQRDIKAGKIRIECGEYPIQYDNNLSVWHNLVLCFCGIATEMNI